jgi:membrane protein YdbS with pleckstrin-like domain
MNPHDQDVAQMNPHVVQATTTSYPPGIPASGTAVQPVESQPIAGGPQSAQQLEALGTGTEGEVDVWMARYSFKNFVVRIAFRTIVTLCWIALLLYFGGRRHNLGNLSWEWFVGLTGGAIAFYWLVLAWQILLARLGHAYRLTNRRVFVNTGVFRHRRDQVELLRVQDVYVKQQRLADRLLDVGNVVIESSEQRLPVHYLVGVDRPNQVMDLLWHQARKERDLRSVKVDEV